ncbi:MAG: hypothetical protein M1812_007206 [Candelaria pacifica]|nr:MAG: hypothetical protein M1812_007206 [Candelaria pacifica]
MQFLSLIVGSIATLAATTIAAPAGGPQQPVAPNQYLLTVDVAASGLDINKLGYTSLVSYANSSLWIGGIKSQLYSEPFIASGSNGGIYFTSWHSVPTGGVSLELYPNQTKALGTTVPHGGSPFPGGSLSGFNFDGTLRLNYNGEFNFIGCQTEEQKKLQTYQIFWKGADEIPEGLTCTGELFLHQVAGCNTVG